jgi:hypothetical protein
MKNPGSLDASRVDFYRLLIVQIDAIELAGFPFLSELSFSNISPSFGAVFKRMIVASAE